MVRVRVRVRGGLGLLHCADESPHKDRSTVPCLCFLLALQSDIRDFSTMLSLSLFSLFLSLSPSVVSILALSPSSLSSAGMNGLYVYVFFPVCAFLVILTAP